MLRMVMIVMMMMMVLVVVVMSAGDGRLGSIIYHNVPVSMSRGGILPSMKQCSSSSLPVPALFLAIVSQLTSVLSAQEYYSASRGSANGQPPRARRLEVARRLVGVALPPPVSP